LPILSKGLGTWREYGSILVPNPADKTIARLIFFIFLITISE